MRKTMTLLAAMAVGTMTAAAPAAADIQKYNFEVVGTGASWKTTKCLKASSGRNVCRKRPVAN